MFCPKCGSEVMEGSAFCGACGAKLGTEDEATKPGESPEANPAKQSQSVDAEDRPGTLKEEVRFAKDLKEPITDIPQARATGNALGDELVQFANLYDVYVENSKILLRMNWKKRSLEDAGSAWYYDNSQDPVIEASRQINADVADAERSLRDTRAQITQNEQARVQAAQELEQAAQERDKNKARYQKSANSTAKWAGRKNGCVLLIAAFFMMGGLSAIVTGAVSSDGGTVMVGVVIVALLVFWIIRSRKKGANKTEAAQQAAVAKAHSADVQYRAEDARFRQTLQELAQSDSNLSAQCSQIESQIAELTPIAGEIRHLANERADFLYSVEMLELDELLQRIANVWESQYVALQEMGTLPNEDDWPESRQIAKIVISGRASSLERALEILDLSNYRQADINVKNQQVQAQRVQTEVMAQGFSQMVATQQQLISETRAGFDAVVQQREAHHAQDMAVKAKMARDLSKQTKAAAQANKQRAEQIAKQAESINLQRESNAQQAEYYDDIRDRFNMRR